MWTMLIALIFIVVIAVVVWSIRRQAAAREAASAERMKAILEDARAGNTRAPQPGAPSSGVTPTSSVRGSNAPVTSPLQVGAFTVRAPLIATEHLALYRALKSALPQHEIFTRMNLAAVIQPAANLTGFAREAQERRLADAVADFVVCDLTLKPIAAVQCGARSGKAAENAAFAAASAAAAGVRWVALAAQPLPASDDIRRLVLGA